MQLSRSFVGTAMGLAASLFVVQARAQSSAVSYQGQLRDGGAVVNDPAMPMSFALYDASESGNLVGGPLAAEVDVVEGLFTVEVDFGAAAFNGQDRWLEIAVDGTPLSPRQALTAAPHALFSRNTRGLAVDDSGNVGIGTNSPQDTLHVGDGDIRLDPDHEMYFADGGQIRSADDNHRILFRRSENKMELREWGDLIFSPGAIAGEETAKVVMLANGNVGIGESNPNNARLQVHAEVDDIDGVYSTAEGANSHAVLGAASGTGQSVGVRGINYGGGPAVEGEALNGDGVYGIAYADGKAGVYGQSFLAAGYGVFGVASSSNGYGVYGLTNAEVGGYGVYGATTSTGGYGVYGTTNSPDGFAGYFDGTTVIDGDLGVGTNSPVNGKLDVRAPAGSNGIYAQVDGPASGVFFGGAVAVRADSSSGNGLLGAVSADSAIGVCGISAANDNGYGVYGFANANSGTNYGVYGETNSPSGYAGYFVGNVHVDGMLSKAGGSFKIDHPLDPENKYLYHSFVESPDMKNIYDGTVTTDASGYATVKLPDWFEALNRDFRYQLTIVDEGDSADALWSKIVRKVQNSHFTIRTSRPGIEVSWQVTGIRQDAFANAHRITVEEDKSAKERGLYLHPAEHGQPIEKGVVFERKQRRAQAETGAGR